MMPEELFLQFLQKLPILLIKIFTSLLLFLHILFSVVIYRQTKTMTKIVEAQISPTIVLFSVVHLIASIAVLVWFIFFLLLLP